MSKSVNLNKYSTAMLDVIEGVCETEKSCEIAFPDTKVAQRERFQFYGLIRALEVSGHSLSKKAGRLKFSLIGKSKNILEITYTAGADDMSALYSQVAERISSK